MASWGRVGILVDEAQYGVQRLLVTAPMVGKRLAWCWFEVRRAGWWRTCTGSHFAISAIQLSTDGYTIWCQAALWKSSEPPSIATRSLRLCW